MTSGHYGCQPIISIHMKDEVNILLIYPLTLILSNGQVDEGLFQRKLILKAITPSSWH